MLPAKFTDHHPEDATRQRRGPAVVPGPPAESDPTLEIRHLIEQLQQSARDTRAQLQRAELERDDLSRQLEQAALAAEEMRTHERDQRTQFTEITTIIRDRDHALAAAEHSAHAAARAHEQAAASSRERDELRRQRDETLHRFEGLTRAYSESGMRVSELQKQLAAIRQARDSAHAQISDLTSRLAAQGEEAAELGYQREQARRSQQQAEEEAAAYQKELEQLRREQASEVRRSADLTAQLDEQRRKSLDLAEQKSAVTQAGNEHAVALAEARAQVGSLTQERDTARMLAQKQALDLETLRADFHAHRELSMRAAAEELVTLRDRLGTLETQAREARQEAVTLRQTNAGLVEKLADLEVVAEDASAHSSESASQLQAAQQHSESFREELRQARERVQELTAERAALATHAEDSRLELEAQLVALRSQAADHHLTSTEAPNARELHARFEKQRLQTLELAAQLESAQRSIRELSASLAEARLQVKFALGPRPAGGRAAAAPVIAAPATYSAATFSLGELIPSLRESFERYARQPRESAALLQLHDRVVSYAERARVAQCVALYRLARVFAALLESLAADTGPVNASTLHTIRQAVEFFVFLRDDPEPERFTDPARARVLMVDDDPGNCQCVQLVMEEQMIQTALSNDPTTALLELASEPFDLVLLDVNMPDMNGFELCKRLRELPMHGQTPVVFLTGLATEERREQSILAGGNDFLGKPFNLHELTVKALLLIIQKQVAAGPFGGPL